LGELDELVELGGLDGLGRLGRGNLQITIHKSQTNLFVI
jgi:hypothetical protein